ncbi:MAG: thiol-disulfide oxidoreductase DCC family protein [Puniceicoccaceae bacterium]
MKKKPDKLVIYDGSCGFCSKSVIFIINRDKEGDTLFSANESSFGKKALLEHALQDISNDSLVFIEMGVAHTYSEAGLRICRYLKFPWNIFGIFLIIPRFLRDPVYKFVARNRHRLSGSGDNCIVPSEQISDRFIED